MLIASLLNGLVPTLIKERIRAKEKPAINEDAHQLRQSNAVIRFLRRIFPPDFRLVLLISSCIVSLLLAILVTSPEPLTRIQAFYISALIGLLGIIFIFDASLTVIKTMTAISQGKLENLKPANAQILTQKKSPLKQTSRARKKA